MFVHCGMIIIGFYSIISRRAKPTFKGLLSGICVFACMASFALLLNVIFYKTGIINGETFNMFFISPYFPCTLPVLSMIYQKVPYLVFLLIYLLSFSLGALILFLPSYLTKYIKNKKVKKNNATRESTINNKNE